MHSGIWRDFAQQLAQHYQVTCIDLPGHGRSDPVTPFNLTTITDAIVAALPEEQYCWLGWSLGASVALDVAQRYPERLDALILMAGNPCFTQQMEQERIVWPGMPVGLLEQFARQLTENGTATLLRFLLLQVQGLTDTKQLAKSLKMAASECAAPDAASLQGGLAILKHADLRTALAKTDKPLLVLLGGRDTLVPKTVATAMQQLQPRLQLYCIEQAAHAPFLSHSEITLALITDFIEKQ